MYCTNCGNYYEGNFCPYCGTQNVAASPDGNDYNPQSVQPQQPYQPYQPQQPINTAVPLPDSPFGSFGGAAAAAPKKKNVGMIAVIAVVAVIAITVIAAFLGTRAAGDNTYDVGRIIDNTYENDAIGIGFDLPDDWYFEELEEITDSDFEKMIMKASCDSSGSIMVSVYEDPSDEEDAIAYYENQLEKHYDAKGLMVDDKVSADFDIDGTMHKATEYSVVSGGATINQRIVFCKTKNFMYTIVLSGSEYTVDDMAGYLYSLK